MARDNYFRLLKLSFDPIENDNEIIQAAIEKQLQFWRESVKKGINKAKFQEYLSFEEDIRKVMLDSTGRIKEARIAKFIRDEEEYAEKNRNNFKEYSEKISTKQIEEILKKLSLVKNSNFDSVYDFLNIPVTSDEKKLNFNTKSSYNLLIKRAKNLCEIYRNRNNDADSQKLAGYCVDIFTNGESKKKYDDFIIFKVKDNIIKLVDHTYELNINKIPYEELEKIINISSKNYFSKKLVKNFIELYCERNDYVIEYNTLENQYHASPTPIKQTSSDEKPIEKKTERKKAETGTPIEDKKNTKIPFYMSKWFIFIMVMFAITYEIQLWIQFTVLITLVIARYNKTKKVLTSLIIYMIFALIYANSPDDSLENIANTATNNPTSTVIMTENKTTTEFQNSKVTEPITNISQNTIMGHAYYIDIAKAIPLPNYNDIYVGEALDIFFEENNWSVNYEFDKIHVNFIGKAPGYDEDNEFYFTYHLNLDFITDNNMAILNGGKLLFGKDGVINEEYPVYINNMTELTELFEALE